VRFMMIVKASRDSEAGRPGSEKMFAEMEAYNNELRKAGVLIAAEGLHPSKNGIRLSFSVPGEPPIVTEGPFPEGKELSAGYWLIDVKSHEEAIEWAKRAPDPHGYGDGQIELRQVFEKAEVQERREKEAEQRAQVE